VALDEVRLTAAQILKPFDWLKARAIFSGSLDRHCQAGERICQGQLAADE